MHALPTLERSRRAPREGVLAALLAVALAVAFPFSPGYSPHDTAAQAVAAFVVAAVAVAVVPWTASRRRSLEHRSPAGRLCFAAAVLSAAAAAVHFAVVKMHFDEYLLFGLFFVGAGIAQLAWALAVLLRPARALLLVGAVGNAMVAALWAVDRIWGLPLGPDRWTPEPVGFADSATSAFELALALCCIALLAPGTRGALPQRGTHRAAPAAIVVAVLALTALSLLSVAGIAPSVLPPAA